MNALAQSTAYFSKLGGFLMAGQDITTLDGQKEIFDHYNRISITDLPPDVLQAVFAGAKLGDLQKEISKAAAIAKVDYAEKKKEFLTLYKSAATRRLYEVALEHLEGFCHEKGIDPLAIKISGAMDFIAWLKTIEKKDGKGLSANTIRAFVAACSSFFSFLRLKSEGAIELNPFELLKGKGGKPKRQLAKDAVYPTKKDVDAYVDYFLSCGKDTEALIVIMMANDGFRAGAFESMVISDKNRVTFTSKAKEYKAKKLSKATLLALHGQKGRLFEGYGASKETLEKKARGESVDPQVAARECANKISNEIKNAGKRLKYGNEKKGIAKGQISEVFSPHDFRHYFALELYRATKDPAKVMQALGHTNIAITDTYLRGIGAYLED